MKFSKRVLNLVKKIPKGRVTTYSAIARALNTKAYRAVGQALKRNQNPDKVPCYRVIKSDGSVGGYSWGVREKIRRLRMDGVEVKNGKIDKEFIMRNGLRST